MFANYKALHSLQIFLKIKISKEKSKEPICSKFKTVSIV